MKDDKKHKVPVLCSKAQKRILSNKQGKLNRNVESTLTISLQRRLQKTIERSKTVSTAKGLSLILNV